MTHYMTEYQIWVLIKLFLGLPFPRKRIRLYGDPYIEELPVAVDEVITDVHFESNSVNLRFDLSVLLTWMIKTCVNLRTLVIE
jgi:hypothetical protein